MTEYPPPAGYPPPATAVRKPSWWKRPVALWVALVAGLAGLIIGVAAGAGTKEDSKNTVAAASSSSSASTTTTTSTTSTTTTTTVPTTTTTTLPPEPVVILDQSGSNNTKTDDFTVIGKWTITAELSGGAGTSVRVMSASGEDIDYVSFDADTGGGVSQQRQGGKFFLDISTFGTNWHIVVTDIPG